MSLSRSIANNLARKLAGRLPVPLASSMELRRAPRQLSEHPLASRRVLLLGPEAEKASALIDQLRRAGASVELPSAPKPGDVLLVLLTPQPLGQELAALYEQLTDWTPQLGPQGRVLVLTTASATDLVTDALEGLVRSMARPLGRQTVTINAVLGHSAAQLAPLVMFLASDRACYVTGQCWKLRPEPLPPLPEPAKPQVALLTGACHSVGVAIAKTLAAAHYRVALLDSALHHNQARALCDTLGGEPAGMAFFDCDVRDALLVERAIERARTLSPHGTLDVLINCAACPEPPSQPPMSAYAWHELLSVQLASVVDMTLRAQSTLSPGARIINVAAEAQVPGSAGFEALAACKGAITGFTRQACEALSAEGIAITTVSPGFLQSPSRPPLSRLQREFAKHLTALGQFGLAEDVANLVELLARREAWPLRGQVLRVDGGLWAAGS